MIEKYIYSLKDKEYVVEVIEALGVTTKINFLKRIGGTKGRLPKSREVMTSKLIKLQKASIYD